MLLQFFKCIVLYSEHFSCRLLNVKASHSNQQFLDVIARQFPTYNEMPYFAGRATSNVTYHSAVYNKKTASIIKYLKTDEDGLTEDKYGEVQVFFSILNNVGAIVKPFDIHCISTFYMPEPSDKTLFKLYDKRYYGGFFRRVSLTDILEVIELTDIVGEAILISCHDSLMITDVTPFEHD